MPPSPASLGGAAREVYHPVAEPHPLQTSRPGPQHQHPKVHHHGPGCSEPAWPRVQTLRGGWDRLSTARLSLPGIAGWAHWSPVVVTGSELGPGSSPGHAGEEGEGSQPAAGVMSCFSPMSPALGIQPWKEEHCAKNFHGCVQQSKLTPDLPLIIAVGIGPGANVKGWQPGGDKDKTHLSFVIRACQEGFVFREKPVGRLPACREAAGRTGPIGTLPSLQAVSPQHLRTEEAALFPNPLPTPQRGLRSCVPPGASHHKIPARREVKIDPVLFQTFCPAYLWAK